MTAAVVHEARPMVSVVMANYNGEQFLAAAVDSILAQTFEDFEFIVVDDCSTDGGYEYLTGLDDRRMVIVRNERNLSQTPSLNIGLRRARGKFIARMDSDDISAPDRLERQVDFMMRHADIDILGTQAVIIDRDGHTLRRTNLPQCSGSLWAYSILESPFIHPSVMVRSSVFHEAGQWFDEDVINQDFELWSRLLPDRKGANLPDYLLRYRVHGENMTVRLADTILESTVNIIMRRLQAEGMADRLSRDEVERIYRYLFADRREADRAGVDRLGIARVYWAFCRRLKSEGRAGRQFMHAVVRRAFQSGVWPSGFQRLLARLALMLELAAIAPDSTLRLLGDVPEFLRRRLSA